MAAFFTFRIYSSDRFRCLHPKKIINGELRTIITIMYIMMLVMQASWDGMWTWIKYSEKFIVIPRTTTIIGTPYDYWTAQHKQAAKAINYVECVNLSMQTGVLILLQCFWNYLSNTVAKRSFMSSLEFKFYIFWALASVAVFPVLQYVFRDDLTLNELTPLLAYSIEALIISVLGIRSHRRFNRMLDIFRNMTHGGSIVERLTYFQDMNILLTSVLFFYGLSLFILGTDGLTTAKVINTNKFATGLLMANCNRAVTLMWIIFIFHPRRPKEEVESGSSMGGTTSNYNNNNRIAVGGDIEISYNRDDDNKGSPSSEELQINGDRRLSQRITNFIENKNSIEHTQSNNYLSTLYEPTAKEMLNSKKGNFIRPMSPVTVDSTPTDISQAKSAASTTYQLIASPSIGSQKITIIASRDVNRGACRSISTKLTTSNNSSNRRLSLQEYPMQTMSSVIGCHNDFRFDLSTDADSFDYLGNHHNTKSKANKIDPDKNWLEQSPVRRT